MRRALPFSVLFTSACGWGAGSSWMKEPLVPEEERLEARPGEPAPRAAALAGRTIGGASNLRSAGAGGRLLGTFRNTYYDFPNEAEHTGAPVALMSATCAPIAKVPQGFHDAVCVQGSGSLARGGTVSFAKRDCPCASVCPRTGQRICFEALDPAAFPFGRGAAGTPITPLRSVAADTEILPMGTVIYIPELDGIAAAGEPLDGCFVVEDRGLRVKGEHVDIFAGRPAQTAALNQEVPSNQGVSVVVDAPRCAHLTRGGR
jgi:3D (Asp-Asp-Asp) domain-containing protein